MAFCSIYDQVMLVLGCVMGNVVPDWPPHTLGYCEFEEGLILLCNVLVNELRKCLFSVLFDELDELCLAESVSSNVGWELEEVKHLYFGSLIKSFGQCNGSSQSLAGVFREINWYKNFPRLEFCLVGNDKCIAFDMPCKISCGNTV